MKGFKVGDKVKVRNDLISHKRYGNIGFVKMMEEFLGEVVTISKVNKINNGGGYNFYNVEGDPHNWVWSEEMFIGEFTQLTIE